MLAMALTGQIHQVMAGGAQLFRTEVRVDCSLASGTSGTTTFTLLKGCQFIGTATLSCNQVVFMATTAKPLEWKMSMTIKDADGNVIATKDTTGRDFPSSSSLQGQGYMFAYIRTPVRQ